MTANRKVQWVSRSGRWAAQHPSARWPQSYRITIKRLGGACLPWKFRTYVNENSLMLENQGFSKDLRDAKRIAFDWIEKAEAGERARVWTATGAPARSFTPALRSKR